MEFRRTKNVDTRIGPFPIQKTDGTFITGATGLDSEYLLLGAHAGSAPTWTDCAHESAEIGSTALYYLDVNAAEVNDDFSAILVKSTSTGAIPQLLLINTTNQRADLIAIAGAVVDATAAQLGANVVNWKGSAAAALTGDPYAEAAAVHVHADYLAGHITADYGSTEKAAIDLLDDANGLVNIHDTVDAVAGYVDTEVAAIKTQTDKLAFTTANEVDARAFTVDDKAGFSLAADQSGVTIGTVNALAAAAITSIWDKLLTGITTAGSVGKLVRDYLDAAISSRSSYAGGDTSGVTTLLGRATAPTAAVNASAVRTELATELARVDAAISSRLATAGYTAPPSIAALATEANAEANKNAVIAALPAAAPTAAANADAVWDEAVADHAAAGTTGKCLADAAAAAAAAGLGTIAWTYTLTTDGTTPIPDAEVWVTSDEAGNNVIASGRTNASGVVTFYLDAGDYFIWAQKSGMNFDNPDEETVTV